MSEHHSGQVFLRRCSSLRRLQVRRCCLLLLLSTALHFKQLSVHLPKRNISFLHASGPEARSARAGCRSRSSAVTGSWVFLPFMLWRPPISDPSMGMLDRRINCRHLHSQCLLALLNMHIKKSKSHWGSADTLPKKSNLHLFQKLPDRLCWKHCTQFFHFCSWKLFFSFTRLFIFTPLLAEFCPFFPTRLQRDDFVFLR